MLQWQKLLALEEILNTESAIEELKDSLRDKVLWMTFERAHENVKQIANLLSGIENLIDDDMMFNSDGAITEYGVAQLSLLAKQYNQADKEVRNYQNDIDNLNRLYMQGYYTGDEYKDKLNEIQTSMLDAAADMKKYSDEVIDAYKKMSESELNALDDLIEKRQEALKKKKDYYDYDKTIKEKSKDIQALKAQIEALSGVEGLEAKAQRARLEAEYSEAQQDLNETVNEHLMELSEDALSDLKDTLQDAFDDYWDGISVNFDDIKKLMSEANGLSAESTSTLNKLLQHYDISPTQSQIPKYAGYASGTTSVRRNQLAWTQEHGNEVIVRKSDGAILTPLKAGDSVIPNNLTERLYDIAKGDIPTVSINMPKYEMPKSAGGGRVMIEQKFDSMLTVNGNVDKEALPDLQTILKKSSEYTQKQIAKDLNRAGYRQRF